jgi:type IV pilus assembly protein PilE
MKKGRDMKAVGQRGFTLIELMITVAIVAILASIAYPSYQQYVLSSRRAEAQSEMLTIQLGMEKWRANNSSYAGATVSGVAPSVSNTYYTYSITGADASAYTINAAAQGPQTNDTGCTALTLNQSGAKMPATGCWK